MLARILQVGCSCKSLEDTLCGHRNYYQLSLQFLIRGMPINNPMEDALFFVCNYTEYYLSASLRDAAMVQWMSDFEHLISVLKAGFPAFEKEILQRIESMYTLVRN